MQASENLHNSGRFATLATKDPFMKVKNGLAGW